MKKSYLCITFLGIFLFNTNLYSQITPGELNGQDKNRRVINTAVPFLGISPDSRAAGMGDVGVATSPDVNSQHWNAAKYPFTEKSAAIGLSYTPWLSSIINDMWIGYLSAYKKISKREVIAASLRYFDLGDVELRDDQANDLGIFNPREWAIDASYSLKLSDNLSISGTGRFIHSNLIGNVGTGASQARAGVSAAVDVGLYGQKNLNISAKNAKWSYGLAFTNIGRKLTYSGNSQREFIPINLRVGTAFTPEINMYNKFTFALDFNKLLVPSPPKPTDSVGLANYGDIGMLSGMVKSLADAPDGFAEELKEIMISFGAEYWYNDTFSGRIGYFYENRDKGNRKYITFGLGLKYKAFGFDMAYLVPQQQNNPLAETIRFSIAIGLEGNSSNDITIQE